ncbi:MAG: hypothetical protein JWO94_1888, partial [Verrucomicrobiaceae bacterium]|nr:hypothetical protein [Verrucomicrobiaceae bacterium]
DMAGSVAEWASDGNSTTGYVRGGSYADTAPALLNSAWQTVPKSTLSKSTGLRLALQEAAAPSFAAHPQPVFVKTGQGTSLGATASGAPPLLYQWLKNDVVLPGKSAATLSIASTTLADGGAYRLRVTSNGVSTTSNAASVAVVEVPSPVLRSTIAPNKSTAFAVHVSGAPGQVFDYDWSRTLLSLSNDYTVHGVDKATLQIVSAQQGMTDTYFCTVSVHDAPSVAPIVVAYQLVVYSVPVIAPASRLPYAVVGGAYSYQVPFDPALELGITQWSATGLPKGFTINAKTGLITGTSGTPVTANPQITAINPFGRVTSSVELVISGLPPGMTGNYTSATARHTLNAQHGGRLDLTVSDSAVATGKLIMEGVSYPLTTTLSATVDPAGGAVAKQATATFNVVRKGLLSLKIKVFLDAANNALTGTVGEVPAGGGDPASTTAVTGWHAVNTVSARLGYHTLVLIPPGGVTDPALVPQGTTFASIRVADSGATTVTGTLADGTAFISAGWLGPDQVIVYAPLYSVRGSILGTLRIAQDTAHTMGLGLGDHVTWQHDDLGAASVQRSYKRGFGPLELSVLAGGRYIPPAALVMGLPDTSTPAPAASNAELGFSSGGLAAPFVQDLRITLLNKAVFPTSNAHAVTLTVTPATGLFLGTCQIVDGTVKRSVKYAGTMVPDNAHAGKGIGYGFFTLAQLPDPAKTSPILSGKVLFGTIPAPN